MTYEAYDASNKAHVKKARQKDKFRAEQEASDLKAVIGTP